MAPGTYYIGVSASGNDQYDPNVLDSGMGGTTVGAYQLQLTFQPDAVSQLTGVRKNADGSIARTVLDGDANGTPGGEYNYWFNVQTINDTLAVDKAATTAAVTSWVQTSTGGNLRTADGKQLDQRAVHRLLERRRGYGMTGTVSSGVLTLSDGTGSTLPATGNMSVTVVLVGGTAVTSWVKTSTSTATCALPTGSGLTSGQYNVFWSGGACYGMTGTVSSGGLTLSDNAGSTLPATGDTTVFVVRVDGTSVTSSWVRTSTGATCALPTGSQLTSGQYNIFWSGGAHYGMTGTVSGGVLTLSAGTGSTLPATGDTTVTVVLVTPVTGWAKTTTTAATCTLPTGSNLTSGQYNVFWSSGAHYGMTGTVSGGVLTLSDGAGSTLPVTGDTTVTVALADDTLSHLFTTISAAISASSAGDVIRVVGNNFANDDQGHGIQAVAGSTLTDGQTFKISDANVTYTFEFDLIPTGGTSNGVAYGNIPIQFRSTDPATTIAASIAAAINSVSWIPPGLSPLTPSRKIGGLYARATVSGSVVDVDGPTVTIDLGTSKLLSTMQDNKAYEIGTDQSGAALSDGKKLEVPKGVTLIFDAGAVVKLHGANVDVGSSAQNIDRSLGSVQVLGVPDESVYFTSYFNTRLGSTTVTSPSAPAAAAGDWGGLVFRNNYDYDEQAVDPSRQVLEQEGIFLDYVNHADISYGGGKVTVNGVQDVYDPIYMLKARPTVSFSRITNSADAAMSADPDSLAESEFYGTSAAGIAYTNDYSRVGPDLHGNTVVNNSLNALYLRVATNAGESLQNLDTHARFDDVDMVLAIPENLVIEGASGGPRQVYVYDYGTQTWNTVLEGRIAGSLVIDAGAVVKLDGTRIEAGMGAQLIAEGTAANPVTFTSFLDDTCGAGGTFDTTNNGTTQTPNPGDWGGLYFSPTSRGSLDYAHVFYAGGNVAIEGGFAPFVPVDIRQATVRIADSLFRYNQAETDPGDQRNGRGEIRDPGVIYASFLSRSSSTTNSSTTRPRRYRSTSTLSTG